MTSRDESNPRLFGDQPDPAIEHFVQPKAIAMLTHRGGEYIVFRRRDGDLAADA
jgi:hypothetical protein